MKECVFCGDPGGNVEHIIAQWLIERMKASDYPIVVAHRKEDGIKTRPAHGLKSYTTKVVCEKCNNGWMSGLEVWLQQNMGALVEPTWPILANEILGFALRDKRMFAKWVLKTAVMMDANSMMENIVETAVANALFEDQLIDGLIVDVAYIHERSVGGILSRGFWIRNGGYPPRWQQHKGRQAFKVLIQLNHFAIRVMRAPGTNATYYAPNGRLPLRCYPDAQQPEKTDYRFHSLQEFDRVLELETWSGA